MIRKVLVPIPVSGGIGSVTVHDANTPTGFQYAYMNGKLIQIGLIPPVDSAANGTFYAYDDTKWVPVSGNFANGAWNWSGVAGLVGNITVNIVNCDKDGLYLGIFVFDDEAYHS